MDWKIEIGKEMLEAKCPDGFSVKSWDKSEIVHDLQYHMQKEHHTKISKAEAEREIMKA